MASTPNNHHYKVILLGKSGSGKSRSGNTLLGGKKFISRKSFKSVTQDVQMERVTVNEVTLDVYDTPGLFHTETSDGNVLDKWQPLLQEDGTTCTVILLVVKIDRFTPEDKEAVDLIEEFIPERLVQNTWILFTRGDELEREDLTIQQFIEDTEELEELVQRFHNKYHVFDNISQSPNQVQILINKIKQTARIISTEINLRPDRRIILLGKTGVGKSATGNTILGEKRFRSELSPFSITSQSEIQCGVVLGRNVSVIDTPGLFDRRKSREELAEEIERSVYESSPGPHAFLYVQPINIRFTEQEENVGEKLEQIFGKKMKRYTMILFTHGDSLNGKSVDQMIQEDSSLRRLVDQCGGGYHVFNNKHLRNRAQVRELLQKIDRMVERNGGTCYSNEIYEEAARLRREEERGGEGFKEFFKNMRYFLTAAAIGSGTVFGAVIGAAVGGVGGPVCAGIGSGTVSGAVIGAAVGGVGGPVCAGIGSGTVSGAVIGAAVGGVGGPVCAGIGAGIGSGTVSGAVIGAAVGGAGGPVCAGIGAGIGSGTVSGAVIGAAVGGAGGPVCAGIGSGTAFGAAVGGAGGPVCAGIGAGIGSGTVSGAVIGAAVGGAGGPVCAGIGAGIGSGTVSGAVIGAAVGGAGGPVCAGIGSGTAFGAVIGAAVGGAGGPVCAGIGAGIGSGTVSGAVIGAAVGGAGGPVCAGIGSGTAFGAVIGAAVGGAGGPVCAGIGAGIGSGTAFGAVIGAAVGDVVGGRVGAGIGAGFCVGMASRRNAEQNNQRSEKMGREREREHQMVKVDVNHGI